VVNEAPSVSVWDGFHDFHAQQRCVEVVYTDGTHVSMQTVNGVRNGRGVEEEIFGNRPSCDIARPPVVLNHE